MTITNSPFAHVLREKGLKITTARLWLLRLLSRATRPLSAQEVYEKVGRTKIDQVTVYRTLNSLVEIGIVRQIDFQQGYALFELATLQEHHHAVCVKCARVVDIAQGCTAEMDKVALAESGFAKIERHALEFFGICQQCSR